MKIIFRYPVELTDTQEIPTIAGEILHIGMCEKGLSMWILSKEYRPTKDQQEPMPEAVRRIYCVGTGNATDPTLPLLKDDYISTVPMGLFVWHFFATTLLGGTQQ